MDNKLSDMTPKELLDEAIINYEKCIELCGDDPKYQKTKKKAMDRLGDILNGNHRIFSKGTG